MAISAAAQDITLPPSTFNVCAVTSRASSLARNTAAPQMSSGAPMRPRGTAAPTWRFFAPRGQVSVFGKQCVDLLPHRGGNDAGRDGVDANAVRRHGQGRALRVADDGGLGRAV